MVKIHGMTGKRNAAKPDDAKKASYIHIRFGSQLKAAAVNAAREKGKTLSQWITDLIEKEL